MIEASCIKPSWLNVLLSTKYHAGLTQLLLEMYVTPPWNLQITIKELKKNLEQNETELYSKAQNVLETYSIEDDITVKVDPMFPP